MTFEYPICVPDEEHLISEESELIEYIMDHSIGRADKCPFCKCYTPVVEIFLADYLYDHDIDVDGLDEDKVDEAKASIDEILKKLLENYWQYTQDELTWDDIWSEEFEKELNKARESECDDLKFFEE
jgi:hypothetical protein